MNPALYKGPLGPSGELTQDSYGDSQVWPPGKMSGDAHGICKLQGKEFSGAFGSAGRFGVLLHLKLTSTKSFRDPVQCFFYFLFGNPLEAV